MLQNMWQELVETVDDRSAKGIALALSAGIDRGVLRPGERLPPIRRVARDLQVAPATISAAWSQLARAGLIETDGRRGTRVREASVGPRRYRRALDSRAGYRVDLSTGLPDPRLLPDLHAAMQRVPRDETAHSYLEEPVVPALRAGARYVWHEPVIRRIMLRAIMFVIPAMALWALLPIIASQHLGQGADGFGLLFAALGTGAILGALVLGRVKTFSMSGILLAAGILYAATLAVVILVPNFAVALAALVLSGVAWMAITSTLQAEMQLVLPGWVRARGMAIYVVIFMGSQTAGALTWGREMRR